MNRSDASARQRDMRWLLPLRSLMFVYVSALIMVVGSERMFWYYSGADFWSFAELGAFYSLGAYALMWTMQRYRVTGFWSFIVAVPVFGYIIEGVITPILYEGGPTPFFPAYFTGWHGLLSAVGLWYGLRRLLIADRWRAVLGAAVALGVLWGLQATTMWSPLNLDDPALAESVPAVRSPLDFLGYAVRTSSVLIGGHWLLGRGLWVTNLGRSRTAETLAAGAIAIMVVAWTFVMPWAAPMLAVLLGGVAWVLRRHHRSSTGPTALEQLDGPASSRSLVMLTAMPLTAAGVYASLFAIDPSEEAVAFVMYAIVAIATVSGGAMMAISWIRVLRRAPSPIPPENHPVSA